MTEETQKTQESEEAIVEVTESTSDDVDVSGFIAESKKYRQRAQIAETELAQLQRQLAEARQKQMAEKEQWKELAEERGNEIAQLKPIVEQAKAVEKSMREELLSDFPDEDQDDFKDLPYSQLSKVVTKLKATESIKPEIPSVKGALKGSTKDLESFWEMSKDEKDANWDDTLAEYKKRHNLNKN